MNINTNIILKNNIIKIESNLVFENDTKNDYKYAFYVYYYENQKSEKKQVYTGKYVENNVFEYKPEKSGYYYARCFAQGNDATSRIDKFTETVLFIDDSIKKNFENELKINTEINSNIDFSRVPYPQNDFCILSIKKDSQINIDMNGLNNWLKEHKFIFTDIKTIDSWNTKNFIISTDNKDINETQKGRSDKYIFSGYMWSKDKFYFGQDDIPNCIEENNLYENLGCYTLLSIENDKIKITEDYYGYGGLYYYEDEKFLIACNSNHLLLFILSFINKKYTIDESMLYTIFASNVTLFRTPFTDELLIEGSKKLNLCNDIIIDDEGWHITKRPIYDVLSGSTEYVEDNYNKEILNGKEEFINNVKAVLENKKFSKFILELSGGKDSRATLAALTNIKDFEKKIKIHSTDHEPNDLNTAAGIVNMFNLKWNDYGYNFIIDDLLENIKRRRSCFCGMRYLWLPEEKHEYDLSKMVFNSDSFEAGTIKYYANTVKDKIEFNADMDTLINKYSDMCSRQAVLNYSEVSDTVKNRLRLGISETPGSSPMEKFDNLFICYRTGSHAGNLDRNYYTSATCTAAQTKSLLKAKKMWFHNFKDNKVIFDILYVLNPVLASLPFNSKKFTEEREKVKEKLFYDDIRFKNLRINTENIDKSEYVKAAEIRKKNTTVKYNDNYVDRGNKKDFIFENCLLGIKKLSKINNGKYKYSLCLPLYYYINAEKDDVVEVMLIHNKVYSVLDSIDAIGYENIDFH